MPISGVAQQDVFYDQIPTGRAATAAATTAATASASATATATASATEL